MIQLRKAARKQAKLKIGLAGPSGSGKTMSALKMAHGMTDWDKIAVIDTENGSADIYAHLGGYNVITLEPPFTPERYIEAIEAVEQAGMEVCIVDSISHEWEGEGGILDIHSNMMGNSFTNWGKITPRHNEFIQKILQSKMHVISTMRSKQDYVLNQKDGKSIPEKVGLKAVTREGVDYEFTLVFDLDIRHNATASKDRTELFMDKPSILISEKTGEALRTWASTGEAQQPKQAAADPTDTWNVQPVSKETKPNVEDKIPMISDFQIKRIIELGRELGITEKESINKVISFYKVKGIEDITQKQAAGVITAMMNKKKTKDSEEVVELLDTEAF